MSVVGMNSGGACQADNGVAMDADEAPGLANAVALGQVVEDRDGGRFGEVATIQWSALTLGEAGPAGVAVELAELLLFAVVAADREVAGVTFAAEHTAGILAAETYEVVHEANWPSARGGDVFGTELRQSRLILRTIPRHGSTYLGHDLLKIYEVNRARIRSAVACSSWVIEAFEIHRDEKQHRV